MKDNMIISATEFKSNFGYYLKLVEKGDVFITKNGKTVARISNPRTSAVDKLSGILKGKIPENADRHWIKEARLAETSRSD